MEESDRVLFLAARRGFYKDGISFIVIVGLSPNEEKSFYVTEKKLTEKGINLGTFLLATIFSSENVGNFRLANSPLKVEVKENLASVTIKSAELVQNNNGKLGFKTEMFGFVPSIEKKIPPGSYKIRITASLSSKKNSRLSAEIIPKINDNVATEIGYVNYPMTTLRSPSSVTNYSIASNNSNTTYEGISPRSSMNSQMTQNPVLPISHTLSTSTDSVSMDTLIAKLPNLKPPMPLPRTVQSGNNVQVNGKKENTIFGEGFSVKVPEQPKRKMTAFVVHVHETSNSRLHFIWICDIQKESVINSNELTLEIGNFFEAEFIKENRWRFVKHIREVERLIQGFINPHTGRIQLSMPILSYQPPSETFESPFVYAEFIGKIKDDKKVLPANCIGRNIEVRRKKNKENKFEWIVVRLLDN